MNYLSFQIHSNTDAQGIVDYLDSFLKLLEKLLNQSAAENFATVLPGIATLNNWHPLFVHFPIAFLSSFFMIDLIASFTKKTVWLILATGLLYLGTFSTLLTVIAGLIAENSVIHGENVHAIMERHEFLGLSVLSLATFLSVWRFKQFPLIGGAAIIYRLLSVLLMIFLIFAADLGGLMVYHYAVAVQSTPQIAEPHHHSD